MFAQKINVGWERNYSWSLERKAVWGSREITKLASLRLMNSKQIRWDSFIMADDFPLDAGISRETDLPQKTKQFQLIKYTFTAA